MDENIQNSVVEEESTKMPDDQLKEAINGQLKKIQRQNLLLGAQSICSVILEKITTATNKPGRRTMNDYKRLVKDIQNFCEVGISRKVNADGKTIQN